MVAYAIKFTYPIDTLLDLKLVDFILETKSDH